MTVTLNFHLLTLYGDSNKKNQTGKIRAHFSDQPALCELLKDAIQDQSAASKISARYQAC